MDGRLRGAVRLVIGVCLVAVLGGCSDGGQPTVGGSSSFPPARPPGVEDPAKVAAGSADLDTSCNPRASRRPPATMPAAGQMPAGSAMAAIAQRGRLIVGVDQNTYLFGYRNPASGQIEGFDIDVAREVARAIFDDPDRIQLVTMTSAQRIPAVAKGGGEPGQVDLVADTMTMNCARWGEVDFSSVYYEAGQRVLVNRDSPVRGIGDLGGKKVCAAAGSTSIRNIAAAASKPIPVSVPDWSDCLVLLQQGQVDAVSTDDTILSGLAAQDPNTHLVGARFSQEPYGLAISRNSPGLAAFVNGVLERMRRDGTLRAINTKWLKDNAPPVPDATYQD
jgi:polar amino acid transport system substrate-binding protein